MKKNLKKFLLAWASILCLILPSEILLAEESTTDPEVKTLDSGAIAVYFNDISSYRNEKDTYVDKDGNSYEYFNEKIDAPAGYEGWIFAGWYKSDTVSKANALSNQDTSGSAWAKFVPAKILSVKAQVSTGTFYDSPDAYIRFVTTVDSLNYARVGFDFIVEGQERLGRDSKTVYEFLHGVGKAGKKLNYTPDNNFHSMSKYFVVHTFSGLPNKAFGHGVKATPYWVTLDGTKVYGEQDIKSVNQGYTSWIKNVDTSLVKTYNNANSYYSQGGCTDGKYYYQTEISKATDDNKVYIRKYNMENYSSQPQSSSLLALDHANDMTYNEHLSYTGDAKKSGLLVIANNGDTDETKNRISFVDPDTLTIVNPKNIEGIDWSEDLATALNDQYIELDNMVYAIDYNATREQYVVGIANAYSFIIYDANFNKVSGPYSLSTEVKEGGYTKQGVGSDDSFIYFIYFDKNVIEVFDWKGNFVTLIGTDIPEPVSGQVKSELENIFIHDNEIYIACGTNGGMLTFTGNYQTELYKVVPKNEQGIEATIPNPMNPDEPYEYPTLDLALLEAQKGDTVTIVKENITVNSPMEVTADNVTITNKEGVNVTITRGSSLTDNVFENRANNFVLKSGETGSLTVDGATVKGKSIIYNESNASVKLDNITIQNFNGNEGSTYSALYNLGTMTLQSSTFKNNEAHTGSVLYADSGTIVIEDCTMTNNASRASGGAIRTRSEGDTYLTVKNSTFDGNKAKGGNGGAINFCGGDIKVVDTTFQNNQCEDATGGGALAVNEGSTAIIKTTDSYSGPGFYNNQSNYGGGAFYTSQAKVNIEGYTFASNKANFGGAIYVYNTSKNPSDISVDTVTFKNNIVDLKLEGHAIYHTAKNFKIHNSNFITDDMEGYTIAQGNQAATLKLSDTTFTGNGNIHLGANANATAEVSGLLTNATIIYREHETDSTQKVKIGDRALNPESTVTLQPSNIYYHAGTAVLAAANEERIANAVTAVKLANNPNGVTGAWYISDNGTMESIPAKSFTVGTNGNYTTLSEALADDNVTSGTTLYVLNDLTVDSTITVNKNIVLKNDSTNAPNGVTITRGTQDAMFTISSDSKLSVRGKITLDGAELSGNDSLIVNSGILTMGQNVTIQNAKASVDGGAVNTTGEMIAEGTSFINNSSSASGGAIYIAAKGNVSSVNNCTFTSNEAGIDGGAIGTAGIDSGAKISNGIAYSIFNENQAQGTSGGETGRGGAIYYRADPNVTLVIDSCEFSENTCDYTGGAVWTNRPTEIKGEGKFENNEALVGGDGGAILLAGSTTKCSITGQTFKNNKAVYGAAICNNDTTLQGYIDKCEFIGNSATYGRDIWNTHTSKSLTITNAEFQGDSQEAIFTRGNTTLSNVSFSGGNKEVELGYRSSNVGKVTISGKITDAVFVYTHADALVTVASTGIDETSTLSVTPMSLIEGAQILGRDGDSDAAKVALANAAKVTQVTQGGSESGQNWWTVTSEGKLGFVEYASLAEAINDAPAGAVIYVNKGETITETITIDKEITLKTSTKGVTLTRGNVAEMFNVTSDGSLTVDGAINLDGNKETISGTTSLIVNAGTLSLKNGAVVKNASSTTSGGAITTSGELKLEGVLFENNSSSAQGGAIYVADNGNVSSMKKCTFTGNEAGTDGGAIGTAGKESGAKISNGIVNSIFSKNKADYRGGAIYYQANPKVTLVIDGCEFSENEVTAASGLTYTAGGAVWINRPVEIRGEGTFANNKCLVAGDGGAILLAGGTTKCSITGQKFENNSAAYGAAICNNDEKLKGSIDTSDFTSNSATVMGGAIWNAKTASITVTNATFQENVASSEGGAILTRGELKLEDTSFTENTSSKVGGAIYIDNNGNVSSMNNCTFTSNKAGVDGGAIGTAGDTSGAKISNGIVNSKFNNNHADNRGGAIYNQADPNVTLVIDSCEFNGNTCKSAGGAIWTNRPFEIKGEGKFENNNASNNGDGGAILATNVITCSITGQTFNNNNAGWGGALCFNNKLTCDITDCKFNSNTAITQGSAIYTKGYITVDASSEFGNNKSLSSDNVTRNGQSIPGLYKKIDSGWDGSFTFQ